MMGSKGDGSYPSDGGDFGRCYRLLKAVPEWRDRLAEMSAVSPYWKALVANWPEIERVYQSEVGQDRMPKTYALMQSILRPMEDADPHIIRIGGGAIMRVGR